MTLVFLFCALVLLLLLARSSRSEAATHEFFITKEQAYNGMLTADIPPALVIDDGDTVIFNTVMLMEGNLSPDMTFDDMFALRQSMRERNIGVYAFTGPFYVQGAETGDVLEVRVRRIVPGKFAVTHIYPDSVGAGGLPEGSIRGGSNPSVSPRTAQPFNSPLRSLFPSVPSSGPWPWLPARGKFVPRQFPAISQEIWTTRNSLRGRLCISP